VYSL
jgi:hypothetical protein